MKTRFEFLEEMYFPGYMCLLTEKYDQRSGFFDFTPTEPPVCNIVDYLTPRGVHIFISQAGLCLVEQVLTNEGFEMSINEYRDLVMEGRMKIVELYQKYRREVDLREDLQGKIRLTKIRWGKLPLIKMDFDLADHAVTGNFTGVLAPRPVPQTNFDILRI